MKLCRGGDVIDGTGAPRRRADVLIDDAGAIATVGPDLARAGLGAENIIDCEGLCLTPGFIDTHAHTEIAALAAPDLAMKIAQGVTLDIVGQDGLSIAPSRAQDRAALRAELAWLVGDPPSLVWDFGSVDEYLARVDAARPAISIGMLVPHNGIRLAAGLDDARPASDHERARMQGVLDAELRGGGLGFSTGLIYPPCTSADTAELTALCEVAARHDLPFAVHMRSESDGILAATEEMLALARATGVHLHVSHLKILGAANFAQIEPLIALLEQAREGGLRVTADQYPYAASSTMLAQILPSWALAGGSAMTVARLSSACERGEIRRAMEEPRASDGPSTWNRTGPAKIVVSDVASGRLPGIIGKNLIDAAAASGRGTDVLGFALDLLRDERLGVSMITFSQDEAIVERIMKLGWVNVCTDGLVGGRPHPRTYGSFPRVLAHYARTRGVISLEEAVRKMTSQAADAMHLHDRGRLAEGQVADLVGFDPARVRDVATYQDPARFPEGIAWVMTGGRLAWRDGARVPHAHGRGVRP